jgi:protein-tyrosine kinase
MINRPVHLVERAAASLRSGAGLTPEVEAAPPIPPAPVAAPPPPAPAALDSRNGVTAPLAEPSATPGAVQLAAAERQINLDTLMRAGLSVAGQQRSRIAEECRVTVDRVLRDLRSTRHNAGLTNLMLVTSAKPGEGKTFVALNLAANIVQNGLGEVLLVDTDAKADSLSSLLGLTGAPGLLDLAADRTLRADNLLVRTALNGLLYLPIGAHAQADTRTGITRPVTLAIEQIARRFPNHIIVLDCAPCLSSSDPIALASLVTQIVIVVEAERTQRNEVESALELIQACPNVTLVLNKMQRTSNAAFGAYYYSYDSPRR